MSQLTKDQTEILQWFMQKTFRWDKGRENSVMAELQGDINKSFTMTPVAFAEVCSEYLDELTK